MPQNRPHPAIVQTQNKRYKLYVWRHISEHTREQQMYLRINLFNPSERLLLTSDQSDWSVCHWPHCDTSAPHKYVRYKNVLMRTESTRWRRKEDVKRDVTWAREVWVNVHHSECVCRLLIHHSVCVCVSDERLQIWKLWLHSPLSCCHPADQTAVGLMVLVPLRSMQISSPDFRHERWEATNRNRREAALTPPRLLQEKKKETRGWKYGVRFQPFGKYPQFDQKFIMWLLEQLGFPGGCCCTLHSSFNVVNTLKHATRQSACVLMQCEAVRVWLSVGEKKIIRIYSENAKKMDFQLF